MFRNLLQPRKPKPDTYILFHTLAIFLIQHAAQYKCVMLLAFNRSSSVVRRKTTFDRSEARGTLILPKPSIAGTRRLRSLFKMYLVRLPVSLNTSYIITLEILQTLAFAGQREQQNKSCKPYNFLVT